MSILIESNSFQAPAPKVEIESSSEVNKTIALALEAMCPTCQSTALPKMEIDAQLVDFLDDCAEIEPGFSLLRKGFDNQPKTQLDYLRENINYAKDQAVFYGSKIPVDRTFIAKQSVIAVASIAYPPLGGALKLVDLAVSGYNFYQRYKAKQQGE